MLIIYFRYSVAGEMWEGLVPYWKNENNMFLAPSQAMGGIMWVVASGTGSYNTTLAAENVEEDLSSCPDMIDQWMFEWDNKWYKDDTLHFECTKTRELNDM